PRQTLRLSAEDLAEGEILTVDADLPPHLLFVGREIPPQGLAIEETALFRRLLEVVRSQPAPSQQPEAETIDQRCPELFQEIQGERGAAIVELVVEAHVGIKAHAVEQGLELITDQDVAERK